MQELLQTLECKIRLLLQERDEYAREKDALALKVMELQDLLDSSSLSLQELKIVCEHEKQEALLASMVVEEMIVTIDEHRTVSQV